MTEPPKDRRFLALNKQWAWSNEACRHFEAGTAWTECYWDTKDKKFRVWIGRYTAFTTEHVDMVAWAEIPETVYRNKTND